MKKPTSPPDSAVKTTRLWDPQETHRFWLHKALSYANAAANKGGSPHPNVKVGAVLVDSKGNEIAQATNRFAKGVDRRRPERYENMTRSLWINCAEQMALAQALKDQADIKGAKMYVTLEPCAICAGLLAECGLHEVIVPLSSRRSYAKLKAKWKKSIEIGTAKLTEAGVKITAIDMDDTQN